MNTLTYALLAVTMPIELFITMIVVSIVLIIIGLIRSPPVPMTVTVGGMILFFIAVTTSTLNLGNLVANSTVSGDTTIYKYNPDNFTFSQTSEMVMALIGGIFMFIGGVMTFQKPS